MPKQLICEVYEVTAASPEEAKEKAAAETSHKRSVVFAAGSLRELPHPVHLAEVQNMFGAVE